MLRSAVKDEHIGGRSDAAAFDLVPVALPAFVVDQGFGPLHADLRVAPARNSDFGIGCREFFLIQQNGRLCVCGNDPRPLARQKALAGSYARPTHHCGKALRHPFQRGHGLGHQPPWRTRIADTAHRRAPELLRRDPRAVIEPSLRPAPWVRPCVEAHGVSSRNAWIAGGVRDRIRRICEHFPLGSGVGRCLRRACPLKNESGPLADLRPRLIFAVIPNGRAQHVDARPQVLSQIQRREGPMLQIAAGRPRPHLRAVDEQFTARVGADKHRPIRGDRLHVDHPPEMLHRVVRPRHVRMRDPFRVPPESRFRRGKDSA